MEQVTMTINDSLSDQLADKIVAKVKAGNRSRKVPAKSKGRSMTKHYITHYNYTTDQYKWSASLRFAVEEGQNADEIAHQTIKARHGQDRPYQIMYTKQDTTA